MKSEHKDIFSSSAKMSGVTMLSRVFGLIRDQLQAALLGTTFLSDSFTIAFLLPNLLRRLFAEGAMTASFIPVFSDVEKTRGKDETRIFFSSFLTIFFFVMIAVVVLGIIFSPLLIKVLYSAIEKDAKQYILTINLTRIMFPYIGLISFAALFQGVLNVHKNFTVPAFTPVLLNISIITTVLITSKFFPEVFPSIAYAFALGVILGGVAQAIFQAPFVIKTGYFIKPAFRFKDKDILKIGRLFIPGIFGVSIYQINVLISYGFAGALGEGRSAALMFSSRINELTLGVFAVSVATVMLPTLSKISVIEERQKFVSSLSYSLKLLALITIPASVGLFLMGKDIVSLLFEFGKFNENSVLLVSSSLRILAISLFFIAGYRVIAQSFYSMKDTKTPVIVSFCSMLLNASLCFFLPRFFEESVNIQGIALANVISNTLTFTVLGIILKRRIGVEKIIENKSSFIQILLSSLIMACFVFMAGKFFMPTGKASLALYIFSTVGLSSLIYFGILYLLKNDEFGEVLSSIKKRLTRK